MTMITRSCLFTRGLFFYRLVFETMLVIVMDPRFVIGTMFPPTISSEIIDNHPLNTVSLTLLEGTTVRTYVMNGTTDDFKEMADNGTATTASSRGMMAFNNGILSRADYDMVRDIRSKLGLPMTACGCVLNVLAVIVYARMPQNFVNRYLIGLQILDSLFLLCTIYPFFLIMIHGSSAGYTRSYQYYAKYVNNYAYTCFQRANVFCTAVLSVNRCIVMLAPFNQQVKKVFRHPVRILTTTQIITFITSLYVIFKTEVTQFSMPDGSERYILVNNDYYKSNKDVFENVALANSFVFTYIPAISSFIANVCMIAGLIIVSKRKRSSDDPGNKKFFKMGSQKTMVVLVYSGVSLILLVPFMSIPILEQTIPGFGVLKREHYMFITMGSIVALCDIIRSAMGFFVFLGLSRVFRETFIAFILRKNVDSATAKTKTPTS